MSLGNVLGAAAPIAAGYFTGGLSNGFAGLTAGTMSGIAGGAMAGAGIAALTGDDVLMGAASGGLGGYGGADMAGAFNPALSSGIASATGTTNAAVNMAGNALGQGGFNTAAGRGLMGMATPGMAGAASAGANTGLQNVTAQNTGQGFSPYATPDTLGSSATQFSTTGGYDPSAVSNIGSVQTPDYINTALTSDPSKQMLTNNALSTYTDGIEDTLIRQPDFSPIAGSNVAEGAIPGGYVDPSFSAGVERLGGGSMGKGAMKLGLTALPVATAALTPEYEGGSYNDNPMNKYDPTRRLDLSMETGIDEALTKDTGLRLLAKGGYLDGGNVGDGMSDDIPATINGNQPAALADGEFVVPADVVSHLGNGSSNAGSRKLYEMMDEVRRARTGREQQGKEINAERYMPA